MDFETWLQVVSQPGRFCPGGDSAGVTRGSWEKRFLPRVGFRSAVVRGCHQWGRCSARVALWLAPPGRLPGAFDIHISDCRVVDRLGDRRAAMCPGEEAH